LRQPASEEVRDKMMISCGLFVMNAVAVNCSIAACRSHLWARVVERQGGGFGDEMITTRNQSLERCADHTSVLGERGGELSRPELFDPRDHSVSRLPSRCSS